MELYNRLKNILGRDNEEELIESISTVRESLNGLVEERMCKVYSGFLLNELRKRHVPARLINTLDLGFDYEHIFILVPSNNKGYFLADLTFSQFNQKIEQLKQLLDTGYQLMDDTSFSCYFNVITKGKNTVLIPVENIFYKM